MAIPTTIRSSPPTNPTPTGKSRPCAGTSSSRPATSRPWATRCWPAAISPGPISTKRVRWCWFPKPWRANSGAIRPPRWASRFGKTPNGAWREVVGVVGHERDDGVDQKASTIVYWPLMVRDFWGQPLVAQRGEAFAIRSTRTGSASFLNEVRQAVWSVNPDLPDRAMCAPCRKSTTAPWPAPPSRW